MRKLLAAGAAAGLVVAGCATTETVRDEPIDDFETRLTLAEPADPEPEPSAEEQLAEYQRQQQAARDLRTFVGIVRGVDGSTLVLEDDTGSRREMLMTRQTRVTGEDFHPLTGQQAMQPLAQGALVRAAYSIEGFDLVAREVRVLSETNTPNAEPPEGEEPVGEHDLEEHDVEELEEP